MIIHDLIMNDHDDFCGGYEGLDAHGDPLDFSPSDDDRYDDDDGIVIFMMILMTRTELRNVTDMADISV